MKGTLMFIHFVCHPAAALFNWNWTIAPLAAPPRLTLSCGKSVADTQLSIIQEDWLLLVMLINNEMTNLAASPRSLTLPHSGAKHFSALLTYDIARLYIQQQNARLLYFISPHTNTSCIPLRGAPDLGGAPLIECELYPCHKVKAYLRLAACYDGCQLKQINHLFATEETNCTFCTPGWQIRPSAVIPRK